ncbi:transferrin receptor protein 1 isoform X2 [Pangasianodon hypophthalmus]|uniref:transferrin receptor protein 1 isoform X2 n=1 Tax=Pangasianodon hypophthalmus TaxID=310915 RepID=UPI002307DDAD|nr:transferrin receptor protein 1 isoform X2 [Pangasianodon hypophthalmus]
MDQARTTITKIFNGTEGSYTRFLTQNMEEDSSHVEMKLSSDMEEEVGENGVVDHGIHHHARPSYGSKNGLCNPRNICIVATVAIVISFVFGILIGSNMYKKTTEEASGSCTTPDSAPASAPADDDVSPKETVPTLDWSDITALLKRKLTTSGIEKSLREFSREDHQAGSPGDEILANKLLTIFKDNSMDPWIDAHFVKVQNLPKSGTNKVTFGSNTYSEPGYLSYSATGTAQGAALYAYYGREDDLRTLQDIGIDMKERVLLVRAGKNSYAEKVANAAKVNASAVLIYPDPADYSFNEDTALLGHVHLGSGDPYTPGFPSFNHTQFPPAKSSGLPSIPAQTIRASTAAAIMRGMGGRSSPRGWADGGLQDVEYKLGNINNTVSVEVNNVLTEIQIHNVFGVIKGYVDPDRYVVIGAQRDAWGSGFAKSTVGTSLLIELARVINSMIHEDGFRPRRSIVFASWSAGEYGAVGATEWLEGYLPSLNMKAFSYISLDGVVTGATSFKASASPLMYGLIQSTLKEVSSPTDPNRSLFAQVAGANWEAAVMEPMTMDDAAYPFLAFSGIPSVSFRFTHDKPYPFFGTLLDTRRNLESKASNVPVLTKAAGEMAGQIALRLVHDHLLRLDTEKYLNVMRIQVNKINKEVMSLQRNGRLPKTLQMKWFMSAIGSYSRASRNLFSTIQNSDLDDVEQCRIINDRIMGVERDLLSPYVSPRNTPFRHILLGSGSCTLQDVLTQLTAIREESASADVDLLKNQFALTTWTIQSCANALAGNVWDMDNDL